MVAQTEPEVEDNEGVQEHLKEAVEGTLRLKRLLSEDSQASQEGGSTKKKRTTTRITDQHSAKVTSLMKKWGVEYDVVLQYVLEGAEAEELQMLENTNWKPDPYNYQKSAADLTFVHLANSRERQLAGGGPLDNVSAFKWKWKLDASMDGILRALPHKELRYVMDTYDGTKDMKELIEEAKQSEPADGVGTSCMPGAPGVASMGRFNRLEIIDATADAAVFGDANLTFALNLAKHRKSLGHVGRVIATTFESLEVLRDRYKEIDETIAVLQELNCEVFHEVDCTRIAVNHQFKGLEGSLGAVYYNFPHAGAVGGFFDGHPVVNWRHENLMRLFFRALRPFVKPGGLVKVASNQGAVGVRYSYITGGARENEFDHVETVPFLQWSLHRYGRAYGDRRDAYRRPDKAENYNCQRADRDMVYTVKFNPSGKTMPPQSIRLPPTLSTLEQCQDGPFANAVGEAHSKLAKQLHERFLIECSGTHVG